MTASPLPIRKEGVEVGLASAPTVFPEGTRLRMLGDQILVRVLPWQPSDILDVQYHGRPLRGVAVSVGPGVHPRKYNTSRSRTWRSKQFRRCEVRVGDLLELGGLELRGYHFEQLLIGSDLHVIVREEDVTFVVDP